jgi:hypothetical protein
MELKLSSLVGQVGDGSISLTMVPVVFEVYISVL